MIAAMVAPSTTRAGMTLVELLVVVAILGLLAVTVLPNMSNTAEDRRTREAVRSVTSFIAKSQSRAIGRPEWAGFSLVPPNNTAAFAIDLFLADVPEVFKGDNLVSTVSGVVNPASLTFSLTTGAIAGATVSGSIGDLVRFNGRGPWYALADTAGTLLTLRTGGSASGVPIENMTNTVLNTAWPAEGVPLTFELARQPKLAGSPFTLADGRCVDLAWSGHGPSSGFTYFGSTAMGQTLTVLFDASGRVRQLAQGSQRITPEGPVLLLVGKSDRAGQSAAALSPADDTVGANWQYADSFWISIDPQSGICRSAECDARSVAALGFANPTAALVESQNFIRSELTTGAR